MKKHFNKLLLILLMFALLITITACTSRSNKVEPRGKAFFSYFDTVSYVYSYKNETEDDFNKNCEFVSSELSRYHQYFDIYNEYPDINNIYTINQNAGKEAIKVDKELIDFLIYAKEIYLLTEGKLNIMIGAVSSLWHDARELASNEKIYEIPDENLLKEASNHISIDSLIIDEQNQTVFINDEKALLDVGGIAKGYAVEKVGEKLKELGCSSYVLNCGGNIKTIGYQEDGSKWVTGIKDPFNPDEDFAMKISIADTSCVTSGTYERYYYVDNVKYHHIIDVDTLFPANYLESLTIICKDSGLADALSTAVFCMSPEKGMAFIESLEGVEAIFILPDSNIKYSSGVNDIIVVN